MAYPTPVPTPAQKKTTSYGMSVAPAFIGPRLPNGETTLVSGGYSPAYSKVLGTADSQLAPMSPVTQGPVNNPNPVVNSGGQPSGGGSPSMDPIMQEINNMASANNNYLNDVQSQMQSGFNTYQQDAQAQQAAQQAQLDASRNTSLQTVATNEQAAEQRRVDALSAARRLYDELMRSGSQRFGGASSAGQAYSELNAQEQQRRMGGIQSDYNTTMTQFENQKSQIEQQYQASIANLQAQTTQFMNEKRRDFDNKLMEISRMRNETEQNKSQMRLEALQQLRNEVFSVNAQALQFKQQLDAQKQAMDYESQQADKRFAQARQEAWNSNAMFAQNASTNPQTGLNIADGGSTAQMNPTGTVSSGKNWWEL